MNWRMQLRTAIEERFDDSELQTLCFDLGLKYEALSGDNLTDKVRELIEHFERLNELPRLISYCKESRKNVPWDEIEAAARAEAATATKEEKTAKAPVLPPVKSSQPWQLMLNPQTIAIAVIGIIVIIGGIYLLVRSPRPETTSLPVTDTPATQTILETAATAVPIAAEATDEPTSVATEAATEIPPTPTNEPTLEPTLEPTVTPSVESTSQAEPTTELSVEEPVEAEPTVLYPDGSPLELVYDFNSFYLYNPSSQRVRVSELNFEALDGAGRPLIYGMAGDRWTQFYSFVDGFACDGIEPFGVGGAFMRPQFCRSYNASVTPAQNGDEIFWIERPGSVEFRVLWDGEEIARCPLGTNTCQVFVPAP
jgi:hypothetical protein